MSQSIKLHPYTTEFLWKFKIHCRPKQGFIEFESLICFNIFVSYYSINQVLRRHNWMHFAIDYTVLLYWIQTKLSWKPENVFY